MEARNRVIEDGDKCHCGGSVDKIKMIQHTPDVWQGRCFVCGTLFDIINPKYGQREVQDALQNKG